LKERRKTLQLLTAQNALRHPFNSLPPTQTPNGCRDIAPGAIERPQMDKPSTQAA
jgi:hypothetical protein